MSLVADARILFKLLRGMPSSGEAASRLEGFYAGQAEAYDAFRERLLHGRQELIQQLQLPDNAYVVELGGGTGRNIDFFGDKLNQLQQYQIVDLCPSLLEVAHKRAKRYPNVSVAEADACTYQPQSPVDCVIFSYSLTMIPDWQSALNNANAMLKPNGKIAVVDFTLSKQQNSLVSVFWRKWFSHDGVHLNSDQPQRLQAMFPHGEYIEKFAKVPYLPFVRVPYYLFIANKSS
ncbi:MAG: class I SAM-dependent methyltransferase [Methylophilus sp.]|nr:class I SAM-dependent methyltransferase [Methylophilus sp.]